MSLQVANWDCIRPQNFWVYFSHTGTWICVVTSWDKIVRGIIEVGSFLGLTCGDEGVSHSWDKESERLH